MKPKISSVLLSAMLLFSFTYKSIAQSTGEETFKQICSACHTVGGGKLVGPDLKNATQRHTEEWLIKFIKSSQSVVKSGDKYADSIFNAFNKIVMPDQASLDDSKIKDLLAYISDKSEGKKEASATSSSAPDAAAAVASDGSNNKNTLYTTTNIILFGIIVFLMIVIVFLSRVIKKLSNQLMDFYSSDRSFY